MNNSKLSYKSVVKEDIKATVYPIQLRLMTDKETKEYHLKRLYELSLKSVGADKK